MSALLWRRLDQEGHEAARLHTQPSGWLLMGTAVFHQGQHPCRLDYHITCDRQWQTRAASITGWLGDDDVAIALDVDPAQRWWCNGVESPAVAGCVDLDLSFSPATNLLPIRRLGLADGQQAAVRAAWLRVPGFTLEPLEQQYQRVDPGTYRYTSAGGSFRAELAVRADGFVTHYPGLWQAVDAPAL